MDGDHRAIGEKIRSLVSRTARIDAGEIRGDVLIREELGIDSLASLEIIAKIERHYGITIPEAQLLSVRTVDEFVELVARHVQAKPA